MIIDWTNPECKISKYFKVKEALTLPSWNCRHIPTEAEKAEILKTAEKMDLIRDFLGTAITVSCWIRPGKVNAPGFDPKTVKIDPKDPKKKEKEAALAALDYNAFVGGAKASAHRLGKAVDWISKGSCDEIRAKIEAKLEAWGIRMEKLPGSNWVHIDTNPPNPNRYFIP